MAEAAERRVLRMRRCPDDEVQPIDINSMVPQTVKGLVFAADAIANFVLLLRVEGDFPVNGDHFQVRKIVYALLMHFEIKN
jgi:hypothetical protein